MPKSVSSCGRAFQDDSGKVVRLAGTCQDISERKEAEEAISFLSRASGVLSSSLDYEMTLESLAAITVPYFCDWCAIYLRTPEGEIERVAVNHADPDLLSLLLEYHAKFPPTPSFASTCVHDGIWRTRTWTRRPESSGGKK